MRGTDAFRYKNVGSGTYGPFVLFGGIYQVSFVGFTGGSAVLNQLGPDGTTYLSVSNSFTANGGDTIYLPPGQYQFLASGAPTDPWSASVVSMPN